VANSYKITTCDVVIVIAALWLKSDFNQSVVNTVSGK